jgi:hypothetical protein
MPAWRLASTASSRAPTWLSGVCCDVILFIQADSTRYLRAHSNITSHFRRRCLPFDCRCENSECTDNQVVSHFANRGPKARKCVIFLTLSYRSAAIRGCRRYKSADLENTYSARNPVHVIRIRKILNGADTKVFWLFDFRETQKEKQIRY